MSEETSDEKSDNSPMRLIEFPKKEPSAPSETQWTGVGLGESMRWVVNPGLSLGGLPCDETTKRQMAKENEERKLRAAAESAKASSFLLALGLLIREGSTCPRRFKELQKVADEIIADAPQIDAGILGSNWLYSFICEYLF